MVLKATAVSQSVGLPAAGPRKEGIGAGKDRRERAIWGTTETAMICPDHHHLDVPTASTQPLVQQPSSGESSRELDPVPSQVGQDMEPEHERICEHGKEERSAISPRIGMRKEGKTLAICLKNSIPRTAVNSSCSQSPVLIPNRQERERGSRSLPAFSASCIPT